MKMEDSGPEAIKRQRLDTFGGNSSSHRIHQQQHPESPLIPLHNSYQGSNAQVLRPPSNYHQPIPRSPYDPPHPSHDIQGLPENQPQGGYAHPHSGFATPNRDPRAILPEAAPGIGRTSSLPAPTRSPDEIQPMGPGRPPNPSLDHEGQHYQPPPNSEQVDPASAGGFAVHEGSTGGMFMSGPTHGLPMAATHHDPSQGHPPTPIAYGEPPIGHPQHALAYNPGPFSTQPGSQAWNARGPLAPPRKNTRAQQACETCRQRKAKCDEGKPICGYCKENSHWCHYKEVQPAKADRAQKEILDQINEAKETQKAIQTAQDEMKQHVQAQIQELGQKFDSLKDMLERVIFKGQIPTDAERSLDRERERSEETSKKAQTTLKPSAGTPIDSPSLQHSQSYTNKDKQRMMIEPGFYSNQDQNTTIGDVTMDAVVVDHITGAHRLLAWDSIRKFVPNISENYVMQHEVNKGLLRLYGKGQGCDSGELTGSGGSPATSSSSKSDDYTRSPAASPPDLWGSNLGPPNIIDGRFSNGSVEDHPGGLNRDGSLKVDKATMDTLRESYLNNIHIMHPFLDKASLRRMFDRFHSLANPTEGTLRSPFISHNSILGPDPRPIRPAKRKFSGGGSPNESGTSGSSRTTLPEPMLERRISTAIVLLVMALGKICLHTAPLPGPAYHSQELIPSGSSPYSTTGSSPSGTISSPLSVTEMRINAINRRGSSADYYNAHAREGDRNVDVIPGLAYFTRAAEILGALQGGNDLLHVQANLLAALYTSQMACVIESWTWIQSACRACHFLVKGATSSTFDLTSDGNDMLHVQRSAKEARKHQQILDRTELIRYAYWTCLQLESDILAEMDLRSSGIDQIDPKSQIRHPKEIVTDGEVNDRGSLIVHFYSFQITLRTTLNLVQGLLYTPNRGYKNRSVQNLQHCEEAIRQWRQTVPGFMQWADDDPPAEDINVARLRAKYYGAKYIIHRPFLYYALHDHQGKFTAKDIETSKIGNDDEYFEKPLGSDLKNHELIRSCRSCVEAAVRSTRAFDGIINKRRLIVTNIFGTAHAQFGNMLVLAATNRSPKLQWLMPTERLVPLLHRTIDFLTTLESISTTLGADAHILRYHVLKPIEPRAPLTTTSSFSSQNDRSAMSM